MYLKSCSDNTGWIISLHLSDIIISALFFSGIVTLNHIPTTPASHILSHLKSIGNINKETCFHKIMTKLLNNLFIYVDILQKKWTQCKNNFLFELHQPTLQPTLKYTQPRQTNDFGGVKNLYGLSVSVCKCHVGGTS